MFDKLNELTPSPGSLDAGALLYEAGRASVPSPWRAWAVASLLALTQALTLMALLLPAPAPRDAPSPGVAPGADAPGSPRPLHVRHLDEEPPVVDPAPDNEPLRPRDLSRFD